MPTPQDQGIHINSKTIGMAVGIITLIGASFAVFEKISTYEVRLNRIEYSESIRAKEIATFTQELKLLNGKLTDLTIELREFRATNEVSKNRK